MQGAARLTRYCLIAIFGGVGILMINLSIAHSAIGKSDLRRRRLARLNNEGATADLQKSRLAAPAQACLPRFRRLSLGRLAEDYSRQDCCGRRHKRYL